MKEHNTDIEIDKYYVIYVNSMRDGVKTNVMQPWTYFSGYVNNKPTVGGLDKAKRYDTEDMARTAASILRKSGASVIVEAKHG